jgi:undecaprenyl-diphosphatase
LSKGARHELSQIRYLDGLGVGMAQALSVLPGISRSGSTIAAGMAIGFDRHLAARFSFLVSVPALAGAALYEGLKLWKDGGVGALTWPLAGFGFLSAFVVGLLSIHILLKTITRFGVRIFAVYCWCIGLLTIVLGLVSS